MNPAEELRQVGTTGVSLTKLGVGTASLGDVFGAVGAEAAAEVVSAGLRAGVGYFDTAPLYGNGLSEMRLGSALIEAGRPRVTISTKVGRTLDPSAADGWRFDFSEDAILRGLELSLARLQLDRVDILYLHDPDHHAREVYREAWPALVRLRDEGVVGAIGFGMNQWQLPLQFVRNLDVDIVMLAGRYTLLDQSAADEFLPECRERGVGVVLAGVFNSGVLVNPVEGAWYDYAPASPSLLARARALKSVAAEFGVSLAALALRFAAGYEAVTSVVVGAGSASSVMKNVDALEHPIPPALWARLRDDGLLSR